MAISVKLNAFEGPLDLLLHLIEKNKIDIYDIPIAEITKQYMEYIKQMETQDMNVTSEFLVMAATLLDIKCRMLLPDNADEEGKEEDPRSELVEKLLEYKVFKYASFELKDMEVDADKNMYRTESLPEEIKDCKASVNYEELLNDVNVGELSRIFHDVVKRQVVREECDKNRYANIEKSEVDMDEKMLFVEAYAREHETFSFSSLLLQQNGKMELIITFLVVLEMMKTGELSITQEELFGDIMIKSNVA